MNGPPEMTPEAIDARLAEVERLRRLRWPRRTPDLSEAAVTARLRTVGQLLRLCRALSSG